MEKIPVIMDVDTGVDDAIAILHALASDKLELLGITTVGGNQTLEKTTRNTLAVLELLGRTDIPVAAGAAGPLVRQLHTAASVHGESGLGAATLPPPTKQPEASDAVTCLRRWIESSLKPVTIVAVAPLTNIAILLKAYPHLKAKIERIVIMGGGAFRGNASPVAEFNIWVDPEAAHMVFQAGVPMVMCGLDVTMQAITTQQDIDAFAGLGNAAGTFCADAFGHYYNFYKQQYGDAVNGCAVHDAVAVMVLTHPELMKSSPAYVEVDLTGEKTLGCTAADFRNRGRLHPFNTEVVMELDREKFIQLLLASAAKFS